MNTPTTTTTSTTITTALITKICQQFGTIQLLQYLTNTYLYLPTYLLALEKESDSFLTCIALIVWSLCWFNFVI